MEPISAKDAETPAATREGGGERLLGELEERLGGYGVVLLADRECRARATSTASPSAPAGSP